MSSVQTISAQQACDMQAKGAAILDVREPWELALASIEGSINVPLSSLPTSLADLTNTTTILCLCHHGMRSMHAAQFLSQHGFAQVFNINGGINAWSISVDANVPRY